MTDKKTIYEFAQTQMGGIVLTLLELSQKTQNFTQPADSIWSDAVRAEMLLCGKGYHIDDIASYPSLQNAWLARLAIPFNIELAATGTLYRQIREFTDTLIRYAYAETSNFNEITSKWIYENPHCLPVFMHVAGSFSKQELKKQIGSASDRSISKPASAKIAELLRKAATTALPDPTRVSERIKATVEGIVRDVCIHGVPTKKIEQRVVGGISSSGG